MPPLGGLLVAVAGCPRMLIEAFLTYVHIFAQLVLAFVVIIVVANLLELVPAVCGREIR